MSRTKPPSFVNVADYWSEEWSVPCPTNRCWGCWQDLPLSRAHIVAHRNGGAVLASNLMIACKMCNDAIDETQRMFGTERVIHWIRGTITSGKVQVPPSYVERFSAVVAAGESVPPLDAAMAMVQAWELACRFRGERMVQWQIMRRKGYG